MALQMDHSYAGITIPDAYFKVIRVSGNKDNQEAIVQVLSSSSQTEGVTHYSFNFPLVTDGSAGDNNSIQQAYTHLKANGLNMPDGSTLDMSGAVDV